MLESALKLFEGEGNRLLWMPAVTLGYLFTKTGSGVDFVFAAVLIVGARAFSDIADEIDERDAEQEDLPTVVPEILSGKFGDDVWRFSIVAIPYVMGTVKGWYLLYDLFDHTDLVIVGLSIGYLGAFLIVLVSALLTKG